MSPALGCHFIPSDVAKRVTASLPPAAPSTVMLLAAPPPETFPGDSKNFPDGSSESQSVPTTVASLAPLLFLLPSEAAVV